MSLLVALVGVALVAALPFWLATRKRPEPIDDPLAASMVGNYDECTARLMPMPAYRFRPVVFMDGLRLRSFRRVLDRAPRLKPYPNHRRKTVEVTTLSDDRRRFVYSDGAP